MASSGLEAPLISEEVSARIARVNDDHIAVPEASDPEVGLGGSSAAGHQEPKFKGRLVLTAVCCIAAIMLFTASYVPQSSRLTIPYQAPHSEEFSPEFDTLDSVDYELGHPKQQMADPRLGSPGDRGELPDNFYPEQKPTYHFRPAGLYMSDPDGPLFYKGFYHFFFQTNPAANWWGNISWGHAVSTDLLNWRILDIILKPGEWYDVMGVWSGSATILKNGTPIILYSGTRDSFGRFAKQATCLAYPVRPEDPLLREWKKWDANPIMMEPDGVRPQDFRDPTSAWVETDGVYRLIMGSKFIDLETKELGDGVALMYTSTDFVNWELQDERVHWHHNTGMWECIDLYPVLVEGEEGIDHSMLGVEHFHSGDYKYVMKVSVDNAYEDRYAVGTYSTETHTFTPDDPDIDTGVGLLYDYGKYYASKTFYDPLRNRRVLWGYANESDSVCDGINKNWTGVQTIPRVVWLDPVDQRYVRVWPVEELNRLRHGKHEIDDFVLQPGVVTPVEGASGAHCDIEVAFEKPDVSIKDDAPLDEVEFQCSMGSRHKGVFGPFGVLVAADDDLIEQTAIFFYVSKLADGRWAYRACSDQSMSTKFNWGVDKTTYGAQLAVHEYDSELHFRILVDHSIIETFVQKGKFAITARVYPTIGLGEKSKVFLFNNGTTPIKMNHLEVYQMGSISMEARVGMDL